EGNTLNDIGMVYRNLGQYQQALDYSTQSLAILREVGNRRDEGSTLSSIGLIYADLGQYQQALDSYTQALAAREDVRAAARLEEFKASLAEQSVSIYGPAILVALRLGLSEEAFTLAERARARSFLDQLGNTHRDLSRAADPR